VRELIDCHVHTARCGHASGTAEDMLRAARSAGLSAVVITEHLPLPDGLDPNGCYAMRPAEILPYAEELARAARAVPEVLLVPGAESDWIPSRAEETRSFRSRARAAGIEVLLGSVHFVEGWAFDDPDLVAEWDHHDVYDVWERYFALWCDAARSGEFEVMAHPDLVKKFGHVPQRDTRELFEAAAAAAAASGVLIEVSSAGLRKPVGELYPGPELLRAFARHGVGATVGSDAHAPEEVGMDISRACDALREAGYTQVCLPLGSGETRRIAL